MGDDRRECGCWGTGEESRSEGRAAHRHRDRYSRQNPSATPSSPASQCEHSSNPKVSQVKWGPSWQPGPRRRSGALSCSSWPTTVNSTAETGTWRPWTARSKAVFTYGRVSLPR